MTHTVVSERAGLVPARVASVLRFSGPVLDASAQAIPVGLSERRLSQQAQQRFLLRSFLQHCQVR